MSNRAQNCVLHMQVVALHISILLEVSFPPPRKSKYITLKDCHLYVNKPMPPEVRVLRIRSSGKFPRYRIRQFGGLKVEEESFFPPVD